MAVVLLCAAASACGNGGAPAKVKEDAAAHAPPPTAIALPALGVDKLARFNSIYGDGAAAYAKALAAYKAKARDWVAVRAGCEAALAKDAFHFDAHYLLAAALAQAGDAAGAADHLATALAGDFFAYAGDYPASEDFAAFRAAPQGKAIDDLFTRIRAAYVAASQHGLWLVARRSPFKWPAKDGVQFGATRGELYAYDRTAKRYLRLTHTDHQVAGFVVGPATGAVALLGFDKVDHEGGEQPPLVARAWLETRDPATWQPLAPRVTLPSARAVAVGFGAGDSLLAATAPATGRWTLGEWTTYAVDATTKKLAKVAQPLPAPRVELTLDEGRVVRVPAIDGVAADWTGDPPTAASLKIGATAIAVPESGRAAHDSVALAPGGASVAFATAVDPCAKDVLPSLYVADAKTGALRHVLTAKSRFAARWLDGTTLAYDDGDGGIRLWDAATGREIERLVNAPGIALDALSLATGTCKPAPVETAGSGDELPPEEPTGSGSAR